MDKKSPDAFRTISEVADWLGVPTHVLRFWESRFSQVKPVKRAGGRRYYRPADMELLGGIRKLLHDDGMTIRGVQKILREEGVKHVAGLSPALDDTSMKDVTPSNVVELRGTTPAEDSEDTLKRAIAETMAEGGSAPKETEEDESTTAPSTPAIAPAAEAPATPNVFAEASVDTQATPGAPAPGAAATAPPQADAPAADDDESDAPLRPVFSAPPTQAPTRPGTPTPPAVPTADSTQDAPLQGGFDFGTPPTDLSREGDAEVVEPPVAEAPASAPQDTPAPTVPAGQAASEALEPPDQIDFHAHGADFTPPPEAEPPASTPVAAQTPQADLAEDHGGNEYDDPEELPRLGAQDLPTLTLSTSVEAEEDAAPVQVPVAPQEEPAVDPAPAPAEATDSTDARSLPEADAETAQADQPVPEAAESPVEEAAALPPLGTEDAPESPSPAPQPPEAPIEAPAVASAEQIAAPAPLPEEVGAPAESAPEAPAPIASADPTQDEDQTAPAPEDEPVEVEAVTSPEEAAEPPPVEAPAAPAAKVIDISHLPADPAEEDISPAGPSLAARMRRLSAGHPHGSPAQVRALADRMQELAERMKRDNPRRSVR